MVAFPHRLLVLSLSLPLLLSGCQSFTVPLPHGVMFNAEGQAVNPAGHVDDHRHSPLFSYRPYEESDYHAHLDHMISEIKQFSGDGPRKLMFFIHGGLIEPRGGFTEMSRRSGRWRAISYRAYESGLLSFGGMQFYNVLQTITNFTNQYEPNLSDHISAELRCRYLQGEIPDYLGFYDTVSMRRLNVVTYDITDPTRIIFSTCQCDQI